MASEIRANKQTNRVGLGTVTYTDTGIIVSGIVTANSISGGSSVTATTFYGSGSALTGIDATSLKDSGGNVKVQANPNGVVVTGIVTGSNANFTGVVTATSFVGSGEGLTGVASTDNIQTATEAEFLSGVKIAGVTTTSGLIDINAGGRANTFKVEDLTSGRVVLAGAGGDATASIAGLQWLWLVAHHGLHVRIWRLLRLLLQCEWLARHKRLVVRINEGRLWH